MGAAIGFFLKRHLTTLPLQAPRHVVDVYTEADLVTDRPNPAEYAKYGTADFAEAAGSNDGALPLPGPFIPATEDQAPAEDDPAGGGGPMPGDLCVRLDGGALPKEPAASAPSTSRTSSSPHSSTTRPPPREVLGLGQGLHPCSS